MAPTEEKKKPGRKKRTLSNVLHKQTAEKKTGKKAKAQQVPPPTGFSLLDSRVPSSEQKLSSSQTIKQIFDTEAAEDTVPYEDDDEEEDDAPVECKRIRSPSHVPAAALVDSDLEDDLNLPPGVQPDGVHDARFKSILKATPEDVKEAMGNIFKQRIQAMSNKEVYEFSLRYDPTIYPRGALFQTVRNEVLSSGGVQGDSDSAREKRLTMTETAENKYNALQIHHDSLIAKMRKAKMRHDACLELGRFDQQVGVNAMKLRRLKIKSRNKDILAKQAAKAAKQAKKEKLQNHVQVQARPVQNNIGVPILNAWNF